MTYRFIERSKRTVLHFEIEIVGKILFIKLHLILFLCFNKQYVTTWWCPLDYHLKVLNTRPTGNIILGVTCWRGPVVSRRQVGSSGSWPSYCSCAGSSCTSVYGRGQNLQERLVHGDIQITLYKKFCIIGLVLYFLTLS